MKKKTTIITVSIMATILLVIGVSYAWLSLTVAGTKTNVIKAGTLNLTLDDTTSNGINMLETVPVLDEIGKNTKGYTFNLKNTGSMVANYTIYLDDVAVGADETKITKPEWIRYTLTTNNEESEVGNLLTIQDETTPTARVLEAGTINGNETKTYTLKLWIGEDATNEIMGQIYRGKLRIEAVQSSVVSVPDKSGANAPELDEGMIPVVYDEGSKNWKKVDVSSEWYNYDKQMWANAVTVTSTNRETLLAAPSGTIIPISDINTMMVWVPRYSYTIIGSTHGLQLEGGNPPSQATPGAIDIKFVKKTDTVENGTARYTTPAPSEWYTHPAFCFGTLTAMNNRTTCDGTEINGFWIGKFETATIETDTCTTTPNIANCNKSTIIPVIKPNMSSWRYAQLGTMFTSVKNYMSGANGNSIYGLNDLTGDSHIIKNMEWAAVAYLSQSKYGKYGNTVYTGVNKEIYINNYASISGYDAGVQTMTGCSAGSPSIEASIGSCAFTYEKTADRGNGTGSGGAGASTTGNIYGIYDMSGGGWEYVMGNFSGYSGYDAGKNSGFIGPLAYPGSFSGVPFPDKKYYDLYNGIYGYKGDATNAGETPEWYRDGINFITMTSPWSMRGGSWYNRDTAGIFNFYLNYGNESSYYSFRIVRTPSN